MLSFEIDDMTAEEIGIATDRLRALPGVKDLVLVPALGKKGRPVHSFRLLVQPSERESVTEACFAETSTIGLRWHEERRAVLPRRQQEGEVRVKITTRLAGPSAKAESGRSGPHCRAGGAPRRQTRGGGPMTQPLETVLQGLPGLAVAVSGGVDSMTLAHAAHRVGLPGLTVVHALSPAVPEEATARVRDHALRFGWRLREVDAGEFADPEYRANPVNRCYSARPISTPVSPMSRRGPIASGANLDDLGDYRPGLLAAAGAPRAPPLRGGGHGQGGRAPARPRLLPRGHRRAAGATLSLQPHRNRHRHQRRGSRFRRAYGAHARPPYAARDRPALPHHHGGIVVEAPAADATARRIAGDLCESEQRAFLGFRPYQRGSAFLHARP